MNIKLNIAIDVLSIAVLAAIFISGRRSARPGMGQRLYNRLVCTVFAVLALDASGWLIDGASFAGAGTLNMCINTAYYAAQIYYCYLWLLYADYWSFCSEKRIKRLQLVYATVVVIELTVIALNPVTGWIFTVSAANVYSRGAYYTWNLIPYYAYILGAFATVTCGYIAERRSERGREKLMLAVYMFLPFCGVIVQSFVYGVAWIWPFVTASLLMVQLYTNQQRLIEEKLLAAKKTEALARVEEQLAKSKISMMLLQIQPHFLFNTLGVVRELCRTDPALAEKATVEFSDFLRGNLESLTADKPISFASELDHTRHYLELERLRFMERLRVEYDIQSTEFRLPTLTLQPIVENAVKYCVTRREDGGTIRITSCETSAAYIVTVEDDGDGFDPEHIEDDGKPHIGIKNVRERLRDMCGGTLEIRSMPKEGTKVIITINKE